MSSTQGSLQRRREVCVWWGLGGRAPARSGGSSWKDAVGDPLGRTRVNTTTTKVCYIIKLRIHNKLLVFM